MNKQIVEFSKEELKQLLDNPNSCVSVKRDVYSLALYPYHLGNFNSSVKELLNARVAKYEKKLGGILLGYRNIKLLTSEGTIVTDKCHVHVDIEADFYIFKPEIGSSLKGIVNKKSGDHVGCLVHRLFNISVPRLDRGDDWFGYFVELGEEVILNVTYIDFNGRLPYIRATLDEEYCMQLEENKEKNHKNKTNKKIKKDSIDKTKSNSDISAQKRKKDKELSTELTVSSDDETTTVKRKKEKRKSLKFDNENSQTLKAHINNSQLLNNFDDQVVTKGKEKKRKLKDSDNAHCSASKISINNYEGVEKHEKEIMSKLKKKKLKSEELNNENNTNSATIISKTELINSYEEQIVKGKKKKQRLTSDFSKLNDEQISTPINSSKSKKMEDSSSKKNKHQKLHISMDNPEKTLKDNVSWESVVLDLHDFQLEKTLEEAESKNKRKRRKSANVSVEDCNNFGEPQIKKRKLEEELPDEDTPTKKHKLKKKRKSIDLMNQT